MLERVFYHYQDLEEFHAGMWRIVRGSERKRCVDAAATLMKANADFGDAMRQAVRLWPKSCEANLTAEAVNRIAWLGHAGCCVGAQSPEEATRVAWHTLTPQEQDAANRTADEVLQEYLRKHRATKMVPDLVDLMGAT